jgi:hypothetical protein
MKCINKLPIYLELCNQQFNHEKAVYLYKTQASLQNYCLYLFLQLRNITRQVKLKIWSLRNTQCQFLHYYFPGVIWFCI